MSSAADSTEGTDTRCQKIRIHPDAQQARVLRKWMQAARYTYNAGLRLIKDGKAKANLKIKKLVVVRREEDGPSAREVKEAPAAIRVRAVLDLIDAHNTAWKGFKRRIARVKTQKSRWKKQKKKEQKKGRRRWKSRANKKIPFEIKYKSKRLTSDSFGFESKSVSAKGKELFLFSTRKKFGMKKGIRMSEAAEHPLDKCCRVSYHFGRCYFLLPYEVEMVDTEWPKEPRRVALNPGVRSFLSYYAEDGEMGKIVHMQPRALKLDAKIRYIRDKIKELQTQPPPSSPMSPEYKAEESKARGKK
jgi:transposase